MQRQRQQAEKVASGGVVLQSRGEHLSVDCQIDIHTYRSTKSFEHNIRPASSPTGWATYFVHRPADREFPAHLIRFIAIPTNRYGRNSRKNITGWPSIRWAETLRRSRRNSCNRETCAFPANSRVAGLPRLIISSFWCDVFTVDGRKSMSDDILQHRKNKANVKAKDLAGRDDEQHKHE